MGTFQRSDRKQGKKFTDDRLWSRNDWQRDNNKGKRYYEEDVSEAPYMKRKNYGNKRNFNNDSANQINHYGYAEDTNKNNETKNSSKDEKEEHIKAKEYYKNAKFKSFRLIIRNLPFKTSKEDVQNICSNFGSFSEIVLPPSKKMEGKCAGFCFVQFKDKETAEKAKEYFNNNKFNGRMVAADWALAKDTYETSAHNEKQALEAKVKEEKKEDLEEDEKSDLGSEESEEREESNDPIEESSETGSKSKKGKKQQDGKKEKKADTAVEEERVVFLRNLSFETTEDALKKAVSKFGTVELAIICKFKDSGHSKGTAFVHFSKKEEAQACLRETENTEFVIDGQIVKTMLAVPREKAVEIEKEAHKKLPSDNRNLRLLRFGLIREGTSAAAGMSAADSAKREKLAQSARKKLENLNMLVSPVRLVIHNLPMNMSDAKLFEICKNAGGTGAYVTECRIWKDTERLNAKGEAKSKGFAFVTFKEHTHALNCLQKLNNNPKTFTNDKRPIVEFSVENIRVLQTKERRAMQSKGEKIDSRALNEKVKKQVRESIGKIHLSGMKFLPKSLGKKMRHRDMSNKKKKKMGLLKKDKSKQQKNPVEGPKKKKSTKKTLTKSLALSF